MGGTVAHLWTKHIRPKTDARYANAVVGTDKAKDADKLDGLDSTEITPTGGDGRTAELALTSSNQVVLSATITTPAAAALLTSASLDFSADGGGNTWSRAG